ncbi:MAG: hypothetical protein ACR2OR_10030 [Hyphomicrobiales bacterium]
MIPQSIGAQESEPSKPLTNVEELGPFPEIYYTDAVLPAQVVKTRNAIVSAARSGDIEKLRPLIDKNKVKIVVSFETTEKDPIAYWKEISTDGTGRSILAEMLKVFSAGFVHVDAGTASDLYIWPYHFMYPLSQLTPEQEVELYLLVPAEYRKDMEDAGGYIGFRGGIDPEGTLHFFVSGE